MTYVTMDGAVLDLTTLSDEERAYFDRCYRAYRDGVSWAAFMNLVRTPENPLLRSTGGRITQAVWDHPLFQALHDMEDRLGVRQGHLRSGADPDEEPLDDEWVGTTEAAKMKGVTVPGIHKAIKRGELVARPIKPGGSRLEVSVASLKRWEVNEVRQSARSKGIESPDRVN